MVSPAPSQGNEMAYAVHTTTCTYLLDEGGVCRWIVSQQGVVPAHVRQCIGAQFVACVDVTVEGGLVGQLLVGARALFIQHTGERMVMLRTGPIQQVDDRRSAKPPSDLPGQPAPPPPPAAALWGPAHGHYGATVQKHSGATVQNSGGPPAPSPSNTTTRQQSDAFRDLQDVVAGVRGDGGARSPVPEIPNVRGAPVSFGVVAYHGEEQTITISKPTQVNGDSTFAEELPTRSR